jgi:hypothetical protein
VLLPKKQKTKKTKTNKPTQDNQAKNTKTIGSRKRTVKGELGSRSKHIVCSESEHQGRGLVGNVDGEIVLLKRLKCRANSLASAKRGDICSGM